MKETYNETLARQESSRPTAATIYAQRLEIVTLANFLEQVKSGKGFNLTQARKMGVLSERAEYNTHPHTKVKTYVATRYSLSAKGTQMLNAANTFLLS